MDSNLHGNDRNKDEEWIPVSTGMTGERLKEEG